MPLLCCLRQYRGRWTKGNASYTTIWVATDGFEDPNSIIAILEQDAIITNDYGCGNLWIGEFQFKIEHAREMVRQGQFAVEVKAQWPDCTDCSVGNMWGAAIPSASRPVLFEHSDEPHSRMTMMKAIRRYKQA